MKRSDDASKKIGEGMAEAQPMPPSLAQITSLLSSISKDVDLLRTAKPRSRDARLLASGIDRACEEIATRCRDYAGVDQNEGTSAAQPTTAAPTPSPVPQPLPAVPAATARIAEPRTPAPAGIRVPARTPDPAPAGGAAHATPQQANQTAIKPTVPAAANVGGQDLKKPAETLHSINHALVVAQPTEQLEDVARRLAAGVSCSYVGLAAQVRHVDLKGFLTEGSRVFVVRSNGEVLGHLPWLTTKAGEGDNSKTYFMFANPAEAKPATGTINTHGLRLTVPIAIGPTVVSRGLADKPDESAAFTAVRAALAREALAASGIPA